ncbi:uncharacterized protein LOC132065561 isoform X1 [Lycium ferocissimum]|uniref:uncharacterized protein LOC132065561 isoform X1 n=1 Tax=Lycium ferocissimum TaxID=112874 RepID=UPI002814BF0E|nr:uncharacterized protein LOC132065561 isoform X1 [Lycium ferocissimum]
MFSSFPFESEDYALWDYFFGEAHHPKICCMRMILLNLSLICYSFPLQDKLRSHPVQKHLLQLLAFGRHELRDAASSLKVRVEVHTGGEIGWISYLARVSLLLRCSNDTLIFSILPSLRISFVAIDRVSCI